MIAANISDTLAIPPLPDITTREDLIDALMYAAEIEHAVMCQYLYAAFSIDRTSQQLSPEHSELARTFVIGLLAIARQEMSHFGMVTNLLVAIGAPPDLDRPNMPIQPNYFSIDLPFQLLPFGDAFLALAAKIEEPYLGPEAFTPAPRFPSIAALYDRIEAGLRTLGDGPLVYLGANDPQIVNADFGATPTQIWYDITLLKVTDLSSACAAIDLIRKQGEGTREDRADSHYGQVRAMKRRWDALAPEVRAALVRPVPSNPVTRLRGDVDPAVACCELRDERALALARLTNRSYEVLLLLLARLYGRCDASDWDRNMYRTFAFFPLMTIVLRPAAEILVQLPAGDGRHAAACTFELDGPIRTFPDREAFHVQLVERLESLAAGFARAAAMPGMPDRCAMIAKNAAYIRDRVQAYVGNPNP